MTARVFPLIIGLALLASACSGGDMDDSAITSDATSGDTSEAEAAEAATPEAATSDADLNADLPDAGTAATADEPTAAAEPAADPALLDPRERGVLRNFLGYEFPPAPDTPTGPIDQAAVDLLEVIWAGLELGGFDGGLVAGLGNTGDARLAWIMSDLLRFFVFGDIHDGSISAFQKLTGVRVADDPVAERSSWQSVTDHLIAWDLPAFPRYAEYKGRLLTLVEPAGSRSSTTPNPPSTGAS